MDIDRIVKLGILCFIIYLLFNKPATHQAIDKAKESSKKITKAIKTDPEIDEDELEGGAIERSLSKVAINVLKTPEGRAFFEKIIQPVNQDVRELDQSFDVQGLNLIKSLFNIRQLQAGKGEECAVCGHLVAVNYMITMANDIILENKTNTIQLGSRNNITALENVVTGMKIGEIRQAFAPSEHAYDALKFRRDDI